MKKHFIAFTTTSAICVALAFAPIAGITADVCSADSATLARPTAAAVLIDGETVDFDAYNIDGNNYFKLRDLAYALDGTAKQFDVAYNAATKAITLTSDKPYTPVGGEMAGKGAGDKTPTPTTSKIILDDKETNFGAYNIGGNNYFKLRDIGAAFDFGVDWDGAKQTIAIDTGKPYTAETTTSDSENAFADFPKDFIFTSGAGAWETSLRVEKDGSFTGYYYDSNMGETGPGYPNGTRYECNFNGKFTDVKQIGAYEYSMRIDSLRTNETEGEERIDDGVRIVAGEPYGLEGLDSSDEILLYLPGRPTEDLPEGFLDWVRIAWDETPATMPFFGLYNVTGDEGFFSEQ
jgi:hypothetical protein